MFFKLTVICFSNLQVGVTSYLKETEGSDFVHPATLKITISHDDEFAIFLTETMEIDHFKTRVFDYFDHYSLNHQLIKTQDDMITFYTKLSLLWFKPQLSTYNGCSEK